MNQYLISTIEGTKDFFVTNNIVVPLDIIKKKRYISNKP